ncbi:hypothetical protein KSP39_PZI012319 [Platanthera zijinensis]|uniref:PGG domain-containing protein n=1 Tax=Platanthera zijinensis TaxID=2320716 RepID=A0AAP0G4S2_9ASPA
MAQIKHEENFDSKALFRDAMDGKWADVIEMYANSRLARETKVTRTKHTVLHLAVSTEDETLVKKLLNAFKEGEAPHILGLKNEDGDTPLHVAAALGLESICKLLTEKCRELVVCARNKAKETPLYIAAHHGKKKAFFVLQDCVPETWLSEENHPISFCRRGDGNTILHAAVHGEYFDLAVEIITLYPRLVNFNNEKGQSALHLLANKPLVFKSGSKMRLLHKLCYACIIVDPIEPKYKRNVYTSKLNERMNEDNEIKAPDNYSTCIELFRGMSHVYHLIIASFIFGERSIKNCYAQNKRQRSKNNNRHGLHAHSSKDFERDAEYGNPIDGEASKKRILPENYMTGYHFLKIVIKFLLIVLGIGIRGIETVKRKKTKHRRACQVMDALMEHASNWEYEADGKTPNYNKRQDEGAIDASKPPDVESSINTSESSTTNSLNNGEEKEVEEPAGDTPILVAAKKGVLEMVKNILETFPVAVQDFDSNHKNIILLSVEHRQPQIYNFMLKQKSMRESIFGMVDKDGNSALHLAAGSAGNSHPWSIPGAALQMQWEIKWYKFVKNSIGLSFFKQQNNKEQTAWEIFTEAHAKLIEEGGKWLTNTSQSCSVVAALIATVAFSSATTVPGGVNQSSGFPILQGRPAFDVFAISALVALCFSVTSLILFLSILTSRYQEMDFDRNLPAKLLMGLTTLFMSIGAMLVSFCAGHFFVMEDKLKYGVLPIYIVTFLPVTLFALSQFPLYVDLLRAVIADVPERTYKSITV